MRTMLFFFYQISLIGRVNILKMNTLPKLLYLFQSIPLPPPESFFQKCKKIFTNFIWNNRRSRLRFTLLYLPYDRGGLKLPNLRWYYWAAQLRAAMCYFSPEEAPAWVKIEACSAQGLSLSSYLYSSEPKKLGKNTKKKLSKKYHTHLA